MSRYQTLPSPPTPRIARPPKALPDFEVDEVFALRSPLLPLDAYTAWHLSTCPENHLLELARRPDVAEALFVASPSLSRGLVFWAPSGTTATKASEAKKQARLRSSLVRYTCRMMTRSTPFGLFAGTSLGRMGDRTQLVLGPRHQHHRHTRLDMDYLYRLVRHLESDVELRRHWRYRPNSSLYRSAGRWRYAEGRLDDHQRAYHLVAVQDDPFLRAVLETARGGATLDALVDALMAADAPEVDDGGENDHEGGEIDHEGGEIDREEGEIDREEATLYLHELIDAQILVSELGPHVTGPEPMHDLVQRLASRTETASLAEQLKAVQEALTALDTHPVGDESPDGPYRRLARQLEPLGVDAPLPRLFQVDLGKSAPRLQLGPAVVDEVRGAVHALYRLRGAVSADPLSTFRQDFLRRYEPGRAVPLVQTLDEEVGIGFNDGAGSGRHPSPLLQGLHFPGQPSPSQVSWDAATQATAQKLFETLRRGDTDGALPPLVWTDADLDALADNEAPPLPDALHVMGSVLASSSEAVDAGDFQFLLKGVHGPSGADLLGRFCHGDDALAQSVREHLQREEAHQPEAVFAEVVHLPEGRIGNILLRPVLRGYEIPFLGHSGAPEERQIPITDLDVTVVGQEVMLFSRRLRRRVLPRLTTAHNYQLRGLGIYRFLCSLPYQNVCGGLSWTWGPFDGLPQLPRVVYGRTILRPATWRVQQEEWLEWQKGDEAKRQAALNAWRRRRGMPSRVLLADGDNELFIDFENPMSVEAAHAIVKERPGFRLLELLQDVGNVPLQGPDGRYAHELILPFSRRLDIRQEVPGTSLSVANKGIDAVPGTSEGVVKKVPGTSEREVPGTSGETAYPPGSEWIYAKLYTGTATADDLLQGPVQHLVQQFSGDIDSWFFLRFGDPDFHLRVRFRVPDTGPRQALQQQLGKLASHLISGGHLWDLQLATYRPEVERYGGPEALFLCETIFRIDSNAVLELLPLLRGDLGAPTRWAAALASVDGLVRGLLDDDPDACLQCADSMRRNFAQEFRIGRGMKRELSQRLRRHRGMINRALDLRLGKRETDEGDRLNAILEILARRNERLREPVQALRQLDEHGQLLAPLHSLATSLAHMTVNRIVAADARAHEAVLYDFLARRWASERARQKVARD